jgi:hypothetical protein
LDEKGLDDLLPEGGFLGSQEGILASIPAKEVQGAGVGGMVFPAFPDFVEEESAGLIRTAMKIVLQAAFLLACGTDESTQLRFQKEVLAFLGTKSDDQSQGPFGKLCDLGTARLSAGAPLYGFLRFSFGHVGGDFTPTEPKRNENCGKRLFFGVLAAGVEVVKIEEGVQDEAVGVFGFASVDGIDGEEDDVAAAAGDIKYGGMLGDVGSALH